MSDIKNILKTQKQFSNLFFDSDALSEKEKIERHKIFALALHSEVSSLADAVHYKDHRPVASDTQAQKILYETVDVMRYCLATLNLWDFSDEDFMDAYDSREAFLWDRETRGIQKWDGSPVIIVDVDDVLARFRTGFFGWVEKEFGVSLDIEDPNYYVQGTVGDMSIEEAYMIFIKNGGIRSLPTNDLMLESITKLHEAGFWVHILTARPKENLKCLYDTYFWLSQIDMPYDSVTLNAEKYRWLSDKPFFKQGKVVCAIDDSPKHAAEYAQHDIPVFVPKRSYNAEVWDMKNIHTFDWEKDSIDEAVKRLLP
tara:strand:- start:8236 stop:9171 length:936 start_codon:yes stop_codon:yes gene_type:complete